MTYEDKITTIINNCNNNTTIIAASKTRSQQQIQQAKEQGLTNFGENYVQEAENKKEAFSDVTLHMIGKLQTNKAKQAVELFDVIHTVNSEKLAKKLNRYCEDIHKKLYIFIQVNIGNEPQKNGVYIEEVPNLIKGIQNLSYLNLLGLMVIPPKTETPVKYFKMANELTKQHGFKNLSMGMSSDYTNAIKNGATHIRIGSAIFGERD